MSMQIDKKSNKIVGKKFLISMATVVLLAAITYGTFAYTNNTWPFGSGNTLENSTLEDSNGNKISDQPADDANQERVNDKKERERKRIEQNEKNEQNRKGKKNVDVVITTQYQDSDGVHVNGYVSGVIENDGTCKLTLTHENGKTVSTTRKSHVNATNTTCGQSTISQDKLSSGKWTISLSYNSENATGKSQANIAPAIEVK